MPTPSEIQTCIDNLTTSNEPIDFTILAAETLAANTGISFSVATVNDLPDLGTANIGSSQIIFVESIGVPVVSTENEWKGLDGRLLKRDFIMNQLWAWGSDPGIGINASTCSPVREISSSNNWCQVAFFGSSLHKAAIKSSGELWSWSNNTAGNLGDGTATSRCSPVREFCSATDWCQVSAGNFFSTAIKTSGQLWAWGTGGRLGDGTFTDRCSPVREASSSTDWCQVSSGLDSSSAIKTSGQLWSWGVGTCGGLGDGTTVTRCSPVREFCSATDWCYVAVGGSRQAAAIKTTGQLWVWGFNCGLLGDGTTVLKCSPVREFCSATDWCQVSIGCFHSVAVKTSGQIWSWGCNLDLFSRASGQLGDGTSVSKCSPVREFCSATDWLEVSGGGDHTAALKTSGQVWTWGYGQSGQLGTGTTVRRCSPVREISSSTDWCQVRAGRAASIGIRTIS